MSALRYHRAAETGVSSLGVSSLSVPGDSAGRGSATTEVGAMLERIQELTGIYGLGFSKDSFLGLVIPIAFVLLVGGLGVALIVLL